MTVKIIRKEGEVEPLILGIERLPPSYRRPAKDLVQKNALLITPGVPLNLSWLSRLVGRYAASIEEEVDSALLQDFHDASMINKPGLGQTLYRLEVGTMRA